VRRRLPLLLIAALPAYVFADLYLRVDLPGAAWLAHQAFRAVVGPLEWLTEGEGNRLVIAAVLWLVAAAVSWKVRPFGRVFWGATAALVGLAQGMTVALAVLMERSLAAGLAVALLLAAAIGGLGWESEAPERARRRWWLIPSIAAGAVACYYVYALFMTYGEGYALLRWSGDLVRERGLDLLVFYVGGVAALQMAAVVLLVRLAGPRRWQRLGWAAAAGTAAAVVLEWLLGGGAAVWPFVLVVPCGVLGVSLLWPRLVARPLAGGLDPRALPTVLLPACLVAALLFGHTYAGRVLRCDRAPEIPGLTRIAAPPEVFRVTLARDGALAAVSLRTSARLAHIPVQPAIGELATTHPGPAAFADPGEPGDHRLDGVVEELVYAPSLDRFFSTLSPDDPDGLDVDMDVQYDGALSDAITNVLLTVSGDGTEVVEAVGVPGLCWINTLRWSESEGLLYIGCEDRPGVHRYDPVTRSFADGNEERAIGDVQKIAIDDAGDRLFTVSLWRRPTLTELDRPTLSPRRQVVIGGSHYDVVHDPATDQVFASAFYGSRVHAVAASTLTSTSTIPAGFGTRSLAVADDLLLVSSVYDGLLRVCDTSSGHVLHSLPVGGHVKDIAIDHERGLAYFWSQCGLFRLELDAVR